nr:hypothetical protein [Tanacetum cinerariifolium]GEZ38819.1 hypothetical protein [Tanacetum cinerariifolium]
MKYDLNMAIKRRIITIFIPGCAICMLLGFDELLWLLFVRVVSFRENSLAMSASAMSNVVVGSEISLRFCICCCMKFVLNKGYRKKLLLACGCFNRESARDVYSKRRIIAVTELQIMEWYDYKHLDWISVCRDDDQIYKFKEGDFKRLRLQDIKDMLLLLVQGKLSNLTVEERLAFNVSLRMFTRSIVIKRRVEDLQLGVESYQKKLNLMKPDTYRPDLRRREAYTALSNPRGFIYQNKDKKNRLMRIDELHNICRPLSGEKATRTEQRQ